MSCFKKGVSLSAALLAGALLLTACGGAPASSASSVPASSVASSEAAEQPEEPAMKYTQTPTVPTETYKEEADFADFLSRAEPGLVIPGLAENLTSPAITPPTENPRPFWPWTPPPGS